MRLGKINQRLSKMVIIVRQRCDRSIFNITISYFNWIFVANTVAIKAKFQIVRQDQVGITVIPSHLFRLFYLIQRHAEIFGLQIQDRNIIFHNDKIRLVAVSGFWIVIYALNIDGLKYPFKKYLKVRAVAHFAGFFMRELSGNGLKVFFKYIFHNMNVSYPPPLLLREGERG